MAARGADKGLTGILRVAAAPTFARITVIPTSCPIYGAAPATCCGHSARDDRPIDLIAEGSIFACGMGTLQDSGRGGAQFATSRRSVLATTDYLTRHGYPQHPHDLSQHEALILANSMIPGSLRALKSKNVVLNGRLHLSAAEGIALPCWRIWASSRWHQIDVFP
ncbi:hypothetical protein LZ023_37060 (plasmid) [Pseudomonas silvicola]|nr:hypothetical protein LZ023_37060 [Pseudomonas silvicola]